MLMKVIKHLGRQCSSYLASYRTSYQSLCSKVSGVVLRHSTSTS